MHFVLVIGETARLDNFSLYGYPKNTNPQLQQLSNLLVLKNTKSCTTYTTGSLACILSHSESISNTESLPTYLARNGAEVIWRSNNWGEPAIKVSSYIDASVLRPSCVGDGCNLDEVLLTNLLSVINSSSQQKIFIVLHTKGSHGPSYYKRYTKTFEQFLPVCKFEEISKCSQKELINAYDNTILYTDHFLTSVVKTLEQLNETSTAMMYISDHGESLGENGLYLHGTPYAFAPDYQKDIPFIMWMSDTFIANKNVDINSIKQSSKHTQFNVFHTVLGAIELESPIYNKNLDILNTQ